MPGMVEGARCAVYDGRAMSMPAIHSPALGARQRRQFKLDTIIRLRWLAVLGQLTAIAVVDYGFEFEVAVIPCLAVIGFAGAVNIALQHIYPPVFRPAPGPAAALLALTIAELGALLFLTGGLANPFSFLLLGPVLISAATLPPRLTLSLGLFAVALAAYLGIHHLPLPWSNDDPLVLPPVYMAGVWLSIGLATGVTSLYAFQATEQSRKLSDALAAAELVLERERHLTQLDGLAAAAAHELGTPLSTIAVIARELERAIEPASPLAADIAVLREQAGRCRDILAKLSQLPDDRMFDRAPLRALIEEVVDPHRIVDITIAIVPSAANEGREPTMPRNPAVLHGLGNLVENAADFAQTGIEIALFWNADEIAVTIADDGPGFPPDILGRIGEPYLSRRHRKPPAAPARGSAQGLGLGLFIAKAFLEHSGAIVTFANRTFPAHGAVATIRWQRATIESDPSAREASVP